MRHERTSETTASRARLPAAIALFALLCAPSWPATVDDVYITLTYARRWAESGALEWTTGERVEGYSNFLFMALMALGARLHLDIDVLAQLVAFGSGCLAVSAFERRLPPGITGALALVALVSWAPLAHWSVIGLETTFYGLLLCAGWTAVLGPSSRWGAGILVLAAASVTRPEGILHLAAGLSTLVLRPAERRGTRALAVGAVAVLAAYHVARVRWFDAILPASYLVKVSPIGLTKYGALQLGGDLLSAGAILGTLVLAGRTSRRDAFWICVPLLIQGATLVRASGDWMSWGRLTLPGVLASAVAFASLAAWRTLTPRPALAAAAGLAVGLAFFLEPRGYGAVDLERRSLSAVARSYTHLRHGLDTPIAEDVSWIIDNAPIGARGLVVDAGILGDIPGFALIDMRGLNHRPAAEAIAAGRAEEWLRATVSDATTRPELLRLANWDGTTHPEYPTWLLAGYSLRKDLRYGGGSIRWYATAIARPTASERAARWDEVLRRHPSHPFLTWHAALSAAEVGDPARATRIATDGARRWPSMAEFRDAPGSLSFVTGTQALAWVGERGFALQCDDEAVSRLIHPEERVRIVLSGEGAPGAAQLTLADPCSSAAPVATDSAWLPICATARQIVVTRTCRHSDAESAFVRLATE